MSRRLSGLAVLAAALVAASVGPLHAAPADTGNIIQRGLKWSEVFTDDAAASVSAFGMLDIDAEAIRTVENVRDLVVALKGLDTEGKRATFGISVTPARTALWPMDLSTYAGGLGYRLLGTTTVGYAQGDKAIQGKNFERRAVSLETSAYLRDEDDPQIALALAHRKGGQCEKILQPAKPAPTTPAPPIAAPAPAGASDDGPRPAAEMPAAEAAAVRTRIRACRDAVTKTLGWNRPRVSLTLGAGWINPKDAPQQDEQLGQAVALAGLWGLGDAAAISGAYRYTRRDPVLTTLVTGPVRYRNRSLALVRLQGGSDSMRALLEVSNAKDDEVTASQRSFKQALGLDVKVAEALWIHFRIGRRAAVTGGGAEESASSLTLSFSPTAFLPGN